MRRILDGEYYDNYAEAHRRSPTYFGFPAAMMHVAIWHPRRFQSRFVNYLTAVFEAFGDKAPLGRDAPDSPAVAAGRVFRRFDYKNHDTQNERLIFEYSDPRFSRVTWRLEVRREFLEITVFAGVELLADPDCLRVCALGEAGGGRHHFDRTIDLHHIRQGRARISDLFYDAAGSKDGLEDQLCDLIAPVLDRIEAWSADKEDGLLPRIFAKLYGCVLPWTTFAVYAPEQNARPFFPRFDHRGLQVAVSDLDEKFSNTSRFLRRIWPDIGSNNDLLNGLPSESIVCYVQNGHAIYISSLGARKNQADTSPLHYLMLYGDHKSWELKSGPSGISTDDPRIDASRRMSRLVGRMNDLAVARLAALKGMTKLRNFAQYLRHIENQFQEQQSALTSSFIEQKKADLFKEANYLGESVVYRSSRAKYYFSMAKTLIEDLGIIGIPGWQPYDYFLRRRLFSTFEYICGLGERFERVLTTINTQYQEQIALSQNKSLGTTTKLLRTAEIFGSLALLYYVPSFAAKFAIMLRHWLQASAVRLNGITNVGADILEAETFLTIAVLTLVALIWFNLRRRFVSDRDVGRAL